MKLKVGKSFEPPTPSTTSGKTVHWAIRSAEPQGQSDRASSTATPVEATLNLLPQDSRATISSVPTKIPCTVTAQTRDCTLRGQPPDSAKTTRPSLEPLLDTIALANHPCPPCEAAKSCEELVKTFPGLRSLSADLQRVTAQTKLISECEDRLHRVGVTLDLDTTLLPQLEAEDHANKSRIEAADGEVDRFEMQLVKAESALSEAHDKKSTSATALQNGRAKVAQSHHDRADYRALLDGLGEQKACFEKLHLVLINHFRPRSAGKTDRYGT